MITLIFLTSIWHTLCWTFHMDYIGYSHSCHLTSFCLNVTFSGKCSLSSSALPDPHAVAHHKLSSSLTVTPFSFRFSTFWAKHPMREMKLALPSLTSSARYWTHCKKSLGRGKKLKTVLIFPESFKITRGFSTHNPQKSI